MPNAQSKVTRHIISPGSLSTLFQEKITISPKSKNSNPPKIAVRIASKTTKIQKQEGQIGTIISILEIVETGKFLRSMLAPVCQGVSTPIQKGKTKKQNYYANTNMTARTSQIARVG
jgi:hypothetical protein